MRHLVTVLLLSLAACPSPSKTEEFCKRADTCNALVTSVDECVDDLDSYLDQLTPSQRDELLYSVQQCLDRPSCNGFKSCVESLRPDLGDELPAAERPFTTK
jgi:hypothetical protein